MKKNNKRKIDFSKKIEEVIPTLWLKEKQTKLEKEGGEKRYFLELTCNWINWKGLKKGKQKVCISMYDEKGFCSCIGITMKQIDKIIDFLKEIKEIVKQLEEEKNI